MELEKLDISTVFSSLIAGSIPVPCSTHEPLGGFAAERLSVRLGQNFSPIAAKGDP